MRRAEERDRERKADVKPTLGSVANSSERKRDGHPAPQMFARKKGKKNSYTENFISKFTY